MSYAIGRTSTWRLGAIGPLLLWYSFLAAGCAHLVVKRSAKGGAWEKVPGVTFFNAKPYLLVYPLEGGTGTGWRIVYLPDQTETYSIFLKGWLGLQSYRLELSEAGTLRSVTAGPAYQASPPEERAYVGREVQATLAAATASEHALVPAPGLYEIVVGDQATGAFSSLRRVPFERLPWSPRVRQIRFETLRLEPEVVSAIVLDLDPPVPPPDNGSCLPPGLEVTMVQDGGTLEKLCSFPLDCKTASQEVRCTVHKPGLHSYLVRATASDAVEGRQMAAVEGRFPSNPDGFAPYQPSAEIHFGVTPEGKVQSITVEYDRRGGSCIESGDPGRREVLSEGSTLTWPRPEADSGPCESVSTFTLPRPAGYVSVSVVPKNAAGLYGKPVFASTAAKEAAAEKAPVFNVSLSATGSAAASQTPSTKEPQGEPPNPPHDGKGKSGTGKGLEDPPRLIDVEGQLTKNRFSWLTVNFTAGDNIAHRDINISGWWTPAESLPKRRTQHDDKVFTIDHVTCPNWPEAKWNKIGSIWHTNPTKPDKTSTERKLSFPILTSDTPSDKPRFLCLQLTFHARDENKITQQITRVITADESLLAYPEDPQGVDLAAARAALAETEWAFSEMSRQQGMRAAFLAYLADDAVIFRPGPVPGRAYIEARPSPPIVLTWQPVRVEVAAAGDLGYTTGPYKVRSTDPGKSAEVERGYYVTVWRRQPDGAWKAVVDTGVEAPPPPGGEAAEGGESRRGHGGAAGGGPTAPAGPAGPAGEGSVDAARRSLQAAESAFAGDAIAHGARAAYLTAAADDARFYREGAPPAVGREAIGRLLAAGPQRANSWRLSKAEAASSGDLGYAYGDTAEMKSGAPRRVREAGMYFRIWRRQDGERWQIALDLMKKLPAEPAATKPPSANPPPPGPKRSSGSSAGAASP